MASSDAERPAGPNPVDFERAASSAIEPRPPERQRLDLFGVLAGGIAHDLNNLLCAIRVCCEVGAKSPGDAALVGQLLADIDDAAARASALTSQMMTFARNQPLQRAPVDVRSVAEGIAKLVGRTIPESITVATELEGPLVVMAESTQIDQLVLNLCTNAIDAMANGGSLTLSTRATIAEVTPLEGPVPCAEITVADTGIGMDEATLRRALDPFFTTKESGSGLGLAITNAIVHQHGGALAIDSASSRGTRVRVLLPLAEDHAVGEGEEATEAPVTP